jgi:hypothetical protein
MGDGAGRKRGSEGEGGQSTVEFALTLMFLMSFVFFFFQLSMVFGVGNYIHYATFMSARALLASGPSQEDQFARARDVMIAMVKSQDGNGDRFSTVAKGTGEGEPKGLRIGKGEQYSPDDAALSWEQGVRYRFRSRLFVIPFGRKPAQDGERSPNVVTLESQSWLGREPAYDECQAEMVGREQGWAFDNGC